MEALKYRINGCEEQAERIKAEYPNITRLDFELHECKYAELVEYAKIIGREVEIENDRGTLTTSRYIGEVSFVIFFYTKALIVSQNIQEVEE